MMYSQRLILPVGREMQGGTLAAVYNAANEVAVDAFCDGQISYTDIWKTVQHVMDEHQGGAS